MHHWGKGSRKVGMGGMLWGGCSSRGTWGKSPGLSFPPGAPGGSPPGCLSAPSPGGCPSRTAADKNWGTANPSTQPHKTARHIPLRSVLRLPRDTTSFPQTPCHQLTLRECSEGPRGTGKRGWGRGSWAQPQPLSPPSRTSLLRARTSSCQQPAPEPQPSVCTRRSSPRGPTPVDAQRGAGTGTGRSSSRAQDPGGSES